MSALLGPYRTLPIPGEEITWAGECPWTGMLCFGTESGRLVFPTGARDDAETIEAVVSEEAVNEVAFWKDLVGIATRAEVLVRRGPHTARDLPIVGGSSNGAHGIMVTPRGRFVAPMGAAGLFCFDAGQSDASGWVDRHVGSLLDYYKVAYAGESAGSEILVCATRSNGLATFRLDIERANRVISLSAPSVDVVDVCPLESNERPFAVVGLSLDRSIVFVNNVLTLNSEDPVRLKFDQVRGTPYSLLHLDSSLILLTSEELVIFPDLAARLLSGGPISDPVPSHHMFVHAVDVFVAGQRQLLILTDEGVRVSDLRTTSSHVPGLFVGENPRLSEWSHTQETPQRAPVDWSLAVA